VYHATTARTVAVTLNMVRAKAIDPSLTCVIVDTEAGRLELINAVASIEPARRYRSGGLEVICAAALWDDLFRAVRDWARQGLTADDIQKNLDDKFHRVLRGQRLMARSKQISAEATPKPSAPEP
jgi:hypothetical protein